MHSCRLRLSQYELHDPDVLVSRMFSEEEEWHRIIMAKFPTIQPDGTIKYPDMRVKEAVDKEAVNQAELKKKRNSKKKRK